MSDAYHRHPAEQRWLHAPYATTRRYTDESGARFSMRDYGPDAPNQNSWHCTYADGTYAYSNPSGSKYHDFGHGNSIYVAPCGEVTHKFNWVEQPSSAQQRASAAAAKSLREDDEEALRQAHEREREVRYMCEQKQQRIKAEDKPDIFIEHKPTGGVEGDDAAGGAESEEALPDDDSIASRVKKEER